MFDEMKRRMEKVLTLMKEDFAHIRSGRAKPSMVEQVMIEAYPGTRMPLVEVASIAAPDAHLLTVQPWDQSIVKQVASGLSKSELHLNPVIDGSLIRISLPPLTQERRLELVKLVKQKVESGREMLRNIRTETKRLIDDREGEANVSEDDISRWLEEMQIEFDKFQDSLTQMGADKEKELMEL